MTLFLSDRDISDKFLIFCKFLQYTIDIIKVKIT